MLKTEMNEWALKAIQLETSLLALEDVGLPASMKAQREKAEAALRELVKAWKAQQPKADSRKWTLAPPKPQGQPEDEELVEVVSTLKEDGVEEWTVHLATSDKGDRVETVLAEGRAWMAAGEEYYMGQWDEEREELEVGRDDEEDELGTGLIFTLRGELVYQSQLEE